MITKQAMKKSHLNDQAKLKVLCDNLCDNIEELLIKFDIEFKKSSKMISMCCPIHDGDNPGAINLYVEGDTYRGNWKCRTHNCEDIFKGSIIGFVRGILSNKNHGWSKKGDQVCSFTETIDFITSFLNKKLDDIKISRVSKEKQRFSNIINNINGNKIIQPLTSYPTRNNIIKNLDIPSKYFLKRGFSKEILVKYDVGFCDKQDKEMFQRAVVPIYDDNHKHMVGCTGRSIFEKCLKCQAFHDSNSLCPHPDNRYLYSKWKHSFNFKSQNHLYNFWFSKEHIKKTNCAIIVESPGNIWRLEECDIRNGVGIFGSSISDRQKMILDASGAMRLIILTDNDEAGKKAADQIKQKCQNTYQIIIPSISKPDIAEMTKEEIQKEIGLYL